LIDPMLGTLSFEFSLYLFLLIMFDSD